MSIITRPNENGANAASYSRYSGSLSDPNLEKLIDRGYTQQRSLIIDQRLIWLDAEGFTSCNGKGVK